VLPAFRLARAYTVADALAMMAEGATPYCGGTELFLAMRMGLLRPPILVDLKRVAELRGVRRAGDTVVIGAGTTHAEIVADPIVRAAAPFLVDVVRRVGNPRVRAQGTVGGNLCFAEPRSDVTTALVCLGATVTLRSAEATRTVPVENFVLGAFETERDDSELLTEVSVPASAADRFVYLKYQIQERPTVAVGMLAGEHGVRLVIGAAGECPVWTDVDSVGDIDVPAMVERLEIVEDVTGSDDYKRHVAGVYARRAIEEFSRRAA
jgi:carbon-monoxide dehydrogenase medium subunit